MESKSILKKLFFPILFICSIALGIGVVILFEENEAAREVIDANPLLVLVLTVEVIVAFIVHLIFHEGGHLIFGLISGYKFSSFRAGSFMWIKEDNKIKLKRLTVSGLDGQCIMEVPDLEEDKIPVKLYMYGGVIMNIIVAIICIVIAILCNNVLPIKQFMIIMAVIGLLIAWINGIPMNTGMANNDGANAREINNDKAKHALLIQLRLGEQQSKGVRIKDMPVGWFEMPLEDDKKSQACTSIGVFLCNRLMDEHKFDEAYDSITKLLDGDYNIAMLHRRLLTCDLIYMELLRGADKEIIDRITTDEQKAFMKNMAKFPSVLRTEYAYALLYENDINKADKVKELFANIAKTYPYPSDIIGEEELIEVVDKHYDNA